MTEHSLDFDPVYTADDPYVLLVTPYTVEDIKFRDAFSNAEGEAAIDDDFSTTLEKQAFDRYGGREAFEEHVLTHYWDGDIEWQWAQSDQLVITGPQDVIEDISAQMEPEAFTFCVMDQEAFTEYALSIDGPDDADGWDIEISLGENEPVLVVTPYPPEMSGRMQFAGMDGTANDPHIREAFRKEALAIDPDFEKFRTAVSETVIRYELTIHFGGNDFIVLAGNKDALTSAEIELEDRFSTQRYTGGELESIIEYHQELATAEGPQGGGAGGLH